MDELGTTNSLRSALLQQGEQIDMQGKTNIPVVGELAVLVERAERACKTTAQLVRDFNFIVVWYQSRPRRRLRAGPILDETSDREQIHELLPDPLDGVGLLGPP